MFGVISQVSNKRTEEIVSNKGTWWYFDGED